MHVPAAAASGAPARVAVRKIALSTFRKRCRALRRSCSISAAQALLERPRTRISRGCRSLPPWCRTTCAPRRPNRKLPQPTVSHSAAAGCPMAVPTAWQLAGACCAQASSSQCAQVRARLPPLPLCVQDTWPPERPCAAVAAAMQCRFHTDRLSRSLLLKRRARAPPVIPPRRVQRFRPHRRTLRLRTAEIGSLVAHQESLAHDASGVATRRLQNARS